MIALGEVGDVPAREERRERQLREHDQLAAPLGAVAQQGDQPLDHVGPAVLGLDRPELTGADDDRSRSHRPMSVRILCGFCKRVRAVGPASRTQKRPERGANLLDDPTWLGDDVVVGELQHDVALEHEGVDPLGVSVELRPVATVPAIAEHLDDHRRAGETAVDTNEAVPGPAADLLGQRHRQCGRGAQLEKAALEPAVPASAHLGAVDDREQLGDPVSSAAPEGDDRSCSRSSVTLRSRSALSRAIVSGRGRT